jgi:IS30 family transposase
MVERKGGIWVMGKFKYLTYDDRKIIEKMYKSGMSTPKIANALGKNYSTVYRELHRCPKDYTADKAQADVDSKKKDKYDITITPKGKHFTYSDRVELEQMIKAGKSIPEMAAHFEKCTRSITREMERCIGDYSADEAQKDIQKAKERQKMAARTAVATRIEKNEKEYKKIIRACLKLDPKADIIDIKIATGFPIERVEKYYDEIYQEVVKKK